MCIRDRVRTAGSNPITKQPWMIGIELPSNNPLVVDRPIASKVQLSNQSLATSGDYRNYVVIKDKKYQHTMDPVSGYPVDRGIFSVSVVADDCLTADGLATGMMAMSLEDTQKLCDDRGIAAFVIYRNDEGEIDWWRSKSFPGEVVLGRETGKKSPSGEQDEKAEEGKNPVYVILGTMIVFGLALSGMAIGVITSNRELKGSCGGLSAMNENGPEDASPCSLCTKPASECSKRSEMEDSEAQKT